MAFTKSPENSTYRTVDMDFTATTWNRSGNIFVRRDPEIINMMFDRNSNENQTKDAVLIKRAGLSDFGIDLGKGGTLTTKVNGFFQDDSTNYIYWALGNKVFSCDLTTNTVTQIATMAGTTTAYVNSVGFCSFLKSTGVRYICFNNGAELWYHVVGTGVSTKVVDADYPGSTYPTVVFLDGYLFVIKKNTGDIYNSDLDDPSSWTAGNYATAEINSDLGRALAKVKNYIVCFGGSGIEFFYDAANLSGSPLGRNESFYKAVTLASNICTIGDSLFFVGRMSGQGLKVYRLDGEQLKDISPSWVDRFLTNSVNSALDLSGFSDTNGFGGSMNGNHFYFLNTNLGYLLVYDLSNNFWYKWYVGTAQGDSTNVIQAVWTGNYQDANLLIALGGQSSISKFSDTTYQDFGQNFTCSYITADYTSETFNWKTCHRVGLYCDYPTQLGTSYAQISWSDDDGNTFTSPRNLQVTTNNPYITQCGRFRSRNWKIEYTDNYPFRMWGLTMDLNVGNV